MIHTDPILRIKMKDIINHRWFQTIKPHMDNDIHITSVIVRQFLTFRTHFRNK